jgi:DNA polymerase-1
MEKPKLISVDIESTGLSWVKDRLHGFAVAWEGEPARYYRASAVPQNIVDLLADPDVEKVGHRLRFDLKFLRQNGFQVRGRWWCSKVLAHLLNENESTGLKYLAEKMLPAGSLSDYAEMQSALTVIKASHVGLLCEADLAAMGPGTWSDVIARYCEEDASNTLKLFAILVKQLRELDAKVKATFGCAKGPLDYYLEESMPAERALLEIELPGIALDVKIVEDYGAELRASIEASEQTLRSLIAGTEALAGPLEIFEEQLYEKNKAKYKTPKRQAQVRRSCQLDGTRFNWGSLHHIGWLFFDHYKLPATKTKAGGRCTDEAALHALVPQASPNVRLILEELLRNRGYQKLLGTYVEGLLERQHGGRVYAEYPPFTTTGRLTSENPNMQNIPRGCLVKRAFQPGGPS